MQPCAAARRANRAKSIARARPHGAKNRVRARANFMSRIKLGVQQA